MGTKLRCWCQFFVFASLMIWCHWWSSAQKINPTPYFVTSLSPGSLRSETGKGTPGNHTCNLLVLKTVQTYHQFAAALSRISSTAISPNIPRAFRWIFLIIETVEAALLDFLTTITTAPLSLEVFMATRHTSGYLWFVEVYNYFSLNSLNASSCDYSSIGNHFLNGHFAHITLCQLFSFHMPMMK